MVISQLIKNRHGVDSKFLVYCKAPHEDDDDVYIRVMPHKWPIPPDYKEYSIHNYNTQYNNIQYFRHRKNTLNMN